MISTRRAEAESESSMAFWFPRVADLRVPRTVFVAIPTEASGKWLEQGVPDWYVEQVAKAAAFTAFPLFMRTDYASGKHRWKDSCYVPDRESFGRHIHTVMEENERKGVGATLYKWLVLRE